MSAIQWIGLFLCAMINFSQMKKTALILFFSLCSILAHAQFPYGTYLFDNGYASHKMEFKENNWFTSQWGDINGGFISNGYYFHLKDTLFLTHVPVKPYGEKSTYSLEFDFNQEETSDSISVFIELFDLDSLPVKDVGFVLIEEDRSEGYPVLMKRSIVKSINAEQEKIELSLPANWEGEVMNFDLSYNHLSIPIRKWRRDAYIRAYLAPQPPELHSGYNSEYSLEKWLIIKKGDVFSIKNLQNEKQIVLSKVR